MFTGHFARAAAIVRRRQVGDLPPFDEVGYAPNEGVIILSWLALWRPVQGLADGWTPIWRKRPL
jgi:hypothetical protein